jgi:hypothetical protein
MAIFLLNVSRGVKLLDLISIDMLEIACSYRDIVDKAEAVGEGFWIFKELIIRVAN